MDGKLYKDYATLNNKFTMKINNETQDRIKYSIFRKLSRSRCWNEKYEPMEYITRAVAGNERGFVKDVLADLKKANFVLFHKNNTCVSLNEKFKAEIEQYVTNYALKIRKDFDEK